MEVDKDDRLPESREPESGRGLVRQVRVRRFGKAVDFIIDDPEDHIQSMIRRYSQFYEQDLLDEVFHRSTPGMRFLDVGANIGNHTLFFSKIVGMEGYALEPNPASFKRLVAHLELNGLSDRVRALNCAAGESSGVGRSLEIDPANSGRSQVIRGQGGIEIEPVDELQFQPFHVLKIDVEGQELDVLQGARGSISAYRPLIFVEAQNQSAFFETQALLDELGYKVTRRFCVTPTYLFESDRKQ